MEVYVWLFPILFIVHDMEEIIKHIVITVRREWLWRCLKYCCYVLPLV